MAYFLKTNKRTGWNKRTGAKCPKLLRSSILLYTKKMWVFFHFHGHFLILIKKKLGFLLKYCELHRKKSYSCGKTLKNNKRTGWNKPVQDGKVVKN